MQQNFNFLKEKPCFSSLNEQFQKYSIFTVLRKVFWTELQGDFYTYNSTKKGVL